MLSVDYSSGQLMCVCLSLTLSVPTLRLMKVLLSSTLRNNIIIVIILAFLGFKLVDYGGEILFWHKNATVMLMSIHLL